MSALARYFAAGGFSVAGYDKTPSPVTDALESEGIKLLFEDDPSLVPARYKEKNNTLVIYTPAIPANSRLMNFFRAEGFRMHKRAELLGVISAGSRSLAIAGTHGKTSVSTLTAHLLKQSDADCSAFLGGISKNYQTNLLTGKSNLTVMEADEYDRSFHYLRPEMALITSLDADHLDVYGNYDNMVQAYNEFAGKIRKNGVLVINEKIVSGISAPAGIKTFTYGFSPDSDFYSSGITVSEGACEFNIHTPSGIIECVKLLIPGKMNIENSLGAVALAKLAGVSDEDIRKALLYYKGVARRFDVRISSGDIIYIDDYAHHPAELEYCIESVRDFYRGRPITGIFQPHLYTRTRDHADGFAAALDKLERAILLPVYPAREEAIKGVDSKMIYDRMKLKNKALVRKEEITGVIGSVKKGVLLTMGAGDIDRLAGPIEEILKKRKG